MAVASLLALVGCTANPSPRCATNEGCALDSFCHAGFCVASPRPDAATSDAGCTRCGDACFDLSSDLRNCGACGAHCDGVCTSGECVR